MRTLERLQRSARGVPAFIRRMLMASPVLSVTRRGTRKNMRSFRRRVRFSAVCWLLFQAASLSALVPLEGCTGRLASTTAQQQRCPARIGSTHCPMHAASAIPCPMSSGSHGDADRRPTDPCSMRGTCDAPVAALFALLSNHGVLTSSSEIFPEHPGTSIALRAAEDLTSRFTPPASPPPRA
jgi:hypothetical protein